jgi:DNA-binding transcriptional LysR family regulator
MRELASHQIEAFFAAAEAASFSKAAAQLHVTQPALSQRIQAIESALETRLFTRGRGGVTVTDAGARLLRYCQAERALRAELLADLAGEEAGAFAGTARIAGFSSVVRSCVLPALAKLLRTSPRLAIEVTVREMDDIADLLNRGATDFALLDRAIERPDIEHVSLGHEVLVLVESTRHRARDDVYLDHDPKDPTTHRFLKRAGRRSRHVARSFLDDIYGILDGVGLGIGRAVVSQHLLAGRSDVRVVPDQTPSKSPVILHWFRQPTHTRAHHAIRAVLLGEVPKQLS